MRRELCGAESGPGTLLLRLKRIGAHPCRRRKFASGRIRTPRAGGFRSVRVTAHVFARVTNLGDGDFSSLPR